MLNEDVGAGFVSRQSRMAAGQSLDGRQLVLELSIQTSLKGCWILNSVDRVIVCCLDLIDDFAPKYG